MGKSTARFSTFAMSRIVGKREEGARLNQIRKTVPKKDGKRGSLRAINEVLRHAREDPDGQGKESSAGGCPPSWLGSCGGEQECDDGGKCNSM